MIRVAVFVILFSSLLNAQVASGGEFVLTRSVIANGGDRSQGGPFQISGTSAQGVAGQKASGQSLAEIAGFWTPIDLQPTAARVSLNGRVITDAGRGIGGVRVTMSGPDGETRAVLSNPFGYFKFNNVEVGRAYIFNVSSRRYRFDQAVSVRNILDSIDDLIFVAIPN